MLGLGALILVKRRRPA
ncbi:MAG: hypothetical protein ACYSTF_07915 [Planctomycetota bacterium]